MFIFDSSFHDELCPQKADVLKLHLSKPTHFKGEKKKEEKKINIKGNNEMFKCYIESHVLISIKQVPSEKNSSFSFSMG